MSHFITIFSGKVIFSLPLRLLSTFKKNTPGLFNPKVRVDWLSGQSHALGLPPHLSPTEIKIPDLLPAGQKRSGSAGKTHVQAGEWVPPCVSWELVSCYYLAQGNSHSSVYRNHKESLFKCSFWEPTLKRLCFSNSRVGFKILHF